MMAARQFIACSPVERCLACQADSVGAVNRCFVARLGQDQRVSMGGYPFGLASEATLHGCRSWALRPLERKVISSQ
jgi:hypothetical protein